MVLICVLVGNFTFICSYFSALADRVSLVSDSFLTVNWLSNNALQ